MKSKSQNNVIVTAADAYYFRTLCQFIYTFRLQKEYKNSELICYDLGCKEAQLAYFQKLIKKIPRLSIRTFDFSQYPKFVELSYKTYSFKPIIIKRVLEEKQGNVFWLDSATILMQPLDQIWNHMSETGLYTPKGGGGRLADWTVQATLDYLATPKSFYNKHNLSGGVCGFSYTHPKIRKLVAEWERYALIHECIKPKESNRSNHRDDQSLLTILVYQLRAKSGIKLTNDEVNISSIRPVKYYSVMNKLKPTFPQKLNFLSVLYFNIFRKIDITINQLKA